MEPLHPTEPPEDLGTFDQFDLAPEVQGVIAEMGISEPTPIQALAITPVLEGRDEKLLQWITDTGLVVLASDNQAVEASTQLGREMTAPGPALPLHEHCLFKLGVHLGEFWYLSELADWLRNTGRYRFFLTAPPLRMPGAVGSPATPVATV